MKTEDGLRLYELFIEKPDKRIFPDYYVVIEKPIALKTIQANLKKGGVYRLLGDVLADFELMCSNAKTYNEDTSPVYALCVNLHDEYVRRVNEALELLRTPKKKKGKSAPPENGDDEDSAPKKKRSRVSNGGGGKKRGKKSVSQMQEGQNEAAPHVEDKEEEQESEEDEEEENVLRITLPSMYLKRAT